MINKTNLFAGILIEMTQLLAEDQPVLDEHGNVNLDVKKPAIFKSQSIILTDEELKELGMNVLSDESAINCEIAEEEENEINGKCDDVNHSKSNEADMEDLNFAADAIETSSKEENYPENENNNDENEESKEELNQNVCVEVDNTNENESIENSLVISVSSPEKATIESEPVNEDKIQTESVKANGMKQKHLPRPISGHKFKIPPMWTPANPRANAAFVYVFFRHVSTNVVNGYE